MFILVNLLSALVYVVDSLLWVYTLIVIAACLMSFVNPDPYNPIVRVIRNLTEPAFWRIRKWLPFVYVRGIDLSPLVLLIVIRLVQMVVIKSFSDFIRLL